MMYVLKAAAAAIVVLGTADLALAKGHDQRDDRGSSAGGTAGAAQTQGSANGEGKTASEAGGNLGQSGCAGRGAADCVND